MTDLGDPEHEEKDDDLLPTSAGDDEGEDAETTTRYRCASRSGLIGTHSWH
jgi:hypothetical protein